MKSPGIKPIIELVGITGVIGSLLFVGVEIDQNSSIARSAAYQNYIQGLSDYNMDIISNPDLISVYFRASTGVPLTEFSELDQARAFGLFMNLARQWEGIYRSVNEGILPEDVLQIISDTFLYPAFVSLWPLIRPSFTDDFVRYIEIEKPQLSEL